VQKRVSLTESQRSSGIGAELLALCQSVTDDGQLSKDEVLELRRWLKDNRRAELPAISFLSETVERIVADHRITRDERQELYRAIELVLPPEAEARKEAVEARREAESEREYRERLARERERQPAGHPLRRHSDRKRVAQVDVAARSRDDGAIRPRDDDTAAAPLASSKFLVAGVHHEGRGAIIEQFAEEGDQVFLARDTASPISSKAIEVRLANGFVIGFVPEEDAEVIAPLLDEGCPHRASIKTILEGGRVPVPVVVSRIYEPDADIDDVVFPDNVPPRAVPATGVLRAAWDSQIGWVLFVVLVIAIFAAAYFYFFRR
jgi:hypothetical protein